MNIHKENWEEIIVTYNKGIISYFYFLLIALSNVQCFPYSDRGLLL